MRAWPERRLVDELRRLARQRSALDAREAVVLAELDRRRQRIRDGATDTGAALAAATGLGAAQARRRVAVARQLSRLPATAAALAAGDIGYAHAAALASVDSDLLGAVTNDESSLLAHARAQGVDEFGRTLAAWAHRQRDEEESRQRAERQWRSRSLRLWDEPDGMVHLRGRLTPDSGAQLRAVLGGIADRLWRQERRAAGDDPDEATNADQRLADALVQLMHQSGPARGDGATDNDTCGANPAVARDGGRAPLGLRSASPDTAPRPPARADAARRPPAATVLVTIPYDPLRRALDLHDAQLLGHGPIPASTARRLACEASIIPAVLGSAGQPLDMGRARRLPNGAQRNALVLRDRGCAFPGCERPHEWCQVHHLRPWNKGGPTDLANLILLCVAHHHLCHEGGWTLSRAPDGTITATPPDGSLQVPAPMRC